jgi:hypothetical protein
MDVSQCKYKLIDDLESIAGLQTQVSLFPYEIAETLLSLWIVVQIAAVEPMA